MPPLLVVPTFSGKPVPADADQRHTETDRFERSTARLNVAPGSEHRAAGEDDDTSAKHHADDAADHFERTRAAAARLPFFSAGCRFALAGLLLRGAAPRCGLIVVVVIVSVILVLVFVLVRFGLRPSRFTRRRRHLTGFAAILAAKPLAAFVITDSVRLATFANDFDCHLNSP